MKTRAGLLLVFVAALWVLSYLVAPSAMGSQFMRAAAEAGMVGGLADWFAVTALFKHPIGLPIPHTALIPRKKDELAGSLGRFVTENFLSADTIRDQMRSAGVVRATAHWLAQDGIADQVAARAVDLARAAVRATDPSAASRLATGVVRTYAKNHSASAALGSLLQRALVQKVHEPLVAKALSGAADAIDARREQLAPALVDLVEKFGTLAYIYITRNRARRMLAAIVPRLRTAAADGDDELRRVINDLLHRLHKELWNDGRGDSRVDAQVLAFLEDESTAHWVDDQITSWLATLESAVSGPDQAARREATALIGGLAQRVLTDDGLAGPLERHLEDFVVAAVERHGDQLTQLIRTKVRLWSPQETARRFELAVGRDLQFIRINGTVVGALAGVAIHALSLLLA